MTTADLKDRVRVIPVEQTLVRIPLSKEQAAYLTNKGAKVLFEDIRLGNEMHRRFFMLTSLEDLLRICL